MEYRFRHSSIFSISLLFLAILGGCKDPRPVQAPSDAQLPSTAPQTVDANQPSVSQPPTETHRAVDRAEFLELVEKLKRDAENARPPKSILEFAIPADWTKSEPRALPTDDHGFTISIHHKSGLWVTLYQYTKGLASIPDDVNAPPVQQEMENAKSGIDMAVQLGNWQAAKEKFTDTVMLGDSQQETLWSQFDLTKDGKTLASDIYVWTHANAFFKLRCTSESEDVGSHQTILRPLLTALGNASTNE